MACTAIAAINRNEAHTSGYSHAACAVVTKYLLKNGVYMAGIDEITLTTPITDDRTHRGKLRHGWAKHR